MEQRSVFVNVVAWIFLVLSGLGILEAVVFMFMPWQELMSQAQMQSAQMPHAMPMMGMHFMRAFSAIWLVLGVWVFASSIGLLLRRNWARISYIVMMALAVGFNALYLLAGILMLVMFHARNFPDNAMFPPGMAGVATGFMAIWIIFAAIFLALFIWILVKLSSEAIAREFRPPSAGLQA